MFEFQFSDTPRITPKPAADTSKYKEIAQALFQNPGKYLLVNGFTTGSGVDYMKKKLKNYLQNGEVKVTRQKRGSKNYVAECVYIPKDELTLPSFTIK